METMAVSGTEAAMRVNREVVLRDFVRFSWRATRGLASAAETEGRELIRRMVETRRVSSEDGEKLVIALAAKMSRSRETFQRRVDASIRRAAERLEEISARELSRLTGHLVEIEGRLARLDKTPGGK